MNEYSPKKSTSVIGWDRIIHDLLKPIRKLSKKKKSNWDVEKNFKTEKRSPSNLWRSFITYSGNV